MLAAVSSVGRPFDTGSVVHMFATLSHAVNRAQQDLTENHYNQSILWICPKPNSQLVAKLKSLGFVAQKVPPRGRRSHRMCQGHMKGTLFLIFTAPREHPDHLKAENNCNSLPPRTVPPINPRRHVPRQQASASDQIQHLPAGKGWTENDHLCSYCQERESL